jgi:hypothetical protein
MFDSKTLKQRIVISNKDATETMSNGFKFTMRNKIIKAEYFKIGKIIISNNFHQINSSNNVLIITHGVTDHTITVPVGNYTDSDLITAIQTQLTAIAATYTITLSSLTGLVTISESTPTNFGIKLASSTINDILGYSTTNLSGAATYTAVNYLNVSWPHITMHSDMLTYDMSKNIFSDQKSNVVACIPLLHPTGDYIHWEPEETILYPLKIEGSMMMFDFYFKDPYNNDINDINKCYFLIELIFGNY